MRLFPGIPGTGTGMDALALIEFEYQGLKFTKIIRKSFSRKISSQKKKKLNFNFFLSGLPVLIVIQSVAVSVLPTNPDQDRPVLRCKNQIRPVVPQMIIWNFLPNQFQKSAEMNKKWVLIYLMKVSTLLMLLQIW